MSSKPAQHHTPCNRRECEICYPKAQPAQKVTKAELEQLRQKIVEIANQNPEKAGAILSDWVNGVQRKSHRKKKVA